MSGFKDKDLMADTGGKTKAQKGYGGKHQRPPRIQQRNEQRNRFLTKDEKLDMNKQSFDSSEDLKKINSEQLDLQIGQNGQVYVKDQPTQNEVVTFSDLVNIPSQVKNIRNYDDFNTSLNNSMNDDSRYDVQIQQQTNPETISMDSFDFKDDDAPQIKNSQKNQTDLILSQDSEEQSDPFDDLFNDDQQNSEEQENSEQSEDTENWGQEEQKEQGDEQNTQEQKQEQGGQNTQKQKQEQGEQNTQEESNDAIDQYLNMQIDDSKLSQQNKKKLDSFTSQQMDAFKKFLYQKKNQE